MTVRVEGLRPIGGEAEAQKSALRTLRTESFVVSPISQRHESRWETAPAIYNQRALRDHWKSQNKRRHTIEEASSSRLHEWLEPPYPLEVLTELLFESVEFFIVVDQLAVDVAGLGWDLIDRELPGGKPTVPETGEVFRGADRDPAAVEQRVKAEEWLKSLPIDYNDQPLTISALYKCVMMDHEATGQGYHEVSRNEAGEVDGLVHVPSRLIRRLKDNSGWVQVDSQGKDVSIYRNWKSDPADPSSIVTDAEARRYASYAGEQGQLKSELKEFRTYHPNEAHYGVPRIIPALVQLYGNIYSRQRNLRFFINRGMPDWLVTVEAPESTWMNPESKDLIQSGIDELQETLQHLIEGDDYRVVFQKVPSDQVVFKWEKISAGLEYADVEAYETVNRDSVIRAYRVLPHRLGIIETASLGTGTGESQEETYKRAQVDPRQMMIEEFLDELLEEQGFNLLSFKWREIDILDEMREATIWNLAWQSKAISLNEARQWLSRIAKDQDFPDWLDNDAADVPWFMLEFEAGGSFSAPAGPPQFGTASLGEPEQRRVQPDPVFGGSVRSTYARIAERVAARRRQLFGAAGMGGNGDGEAATETGHAIVGEAKD
jgi:capsid portal protein